MKIIEWIKGIVKSAWFKAVVVFAANKLKDVLVYIGKEVYEMIVVKIQEVSKLDISGKEKAEIVAKYIKKQSPGLGQSAINYLIESIVQDLKDKRVIK